MTPRASHPPDETSSNPGASDRGSVRGRLVERLTGAVADRRRAEGLFKGLLESAPDAVIVVDENGEIVLVNRQAESMFGYPREQLLGRSVDTLVPAKFHERHASHRLRYAGERRVRPMGAGLDLFGVRADGSEFPVEISLSPVETDGEVLVFAAVRDVSDRKLAEAERIRLASIVESSEDAIFAKALDGTIQSWNRGAERVYGCPREKAIGRDVRMFAPPDRVEEIDRIMERIARGESVENLETLRVRGDGTLVEVAITVSPIRDAAGAVVGASVVSRDVTERRRAEAAQILQRSLLPDRLPEIPGIRLAGRYEAAGSAVDVGGDWYDALVLADGRLCLAIGDVAGKGVRAASLMGQLRDGLRALAFEGHTPARALASLNGLAQQIAHAVATCVCMYVDPLTGDAVFAGAGHPPAFIRRPDGTTHALDPTGEPPLGTLPGQTYTDHELSLDPGSIVFLYTDGLIERRHEALGVGMQRLRSLIERAPINIETIADTALQELGDGGPFLDDVAILAASIEELGPVLDFDLAVDPRELARVRRALNRWLAQHGVGADDAYRIVLAANEACANAIEHAYGFREEPISVHAEIGAEGEITILVRDRGTWRPARGVHRGRGLKLMRGLMDDVEVTPDPTGTSVTLSIAPAPPGRAAGA